MQGLIQAGINRVVIAENDSNPICAAKAKSQLEMAGIQVKVGVKDKAAWAA